MLWERSIHKYLRLNEDYLFSNMPSVLQEDVIFIPKIHPLKADNTRKGSEARNYEKPSSCPFMDLVEINHKHVLELSGI